MRVSEALIPDEVDEQQNLEVDELCGCIRNPYRPGFWHCGVAAQGGIPRKSSEVR